MRRCLELARRAEGRTAPNPIVGSVILDRRGAVIAEGWHERAGALHAEAAALAQIGGRAPGGTLYVNLEPCRHRRNRRTTPCTPAVLASGVRRVVIGALDPIRSHGGGARELARAGIEVVTGVLGAACEEANAPFFTWARHGRPCFLLKAAVTLDGKIATVRGESQWITGAAARRDSHRLRDRCDGVMVGIGTVLADDPRLTVRGVRGGRDPARIVVDSRLRTPPVAKVLPAAGSPARTIIACAQAAPARRRRLEAAGAEIWEIPGARGRVDLAELARRLGAAGLLSVLVEGGGEVHASLMAAGLADELRLYVAPLAVGGPAPSWLGGDGVARLADAWGFRWLGVPERMGEDLVLRLGPRKKTKSRQ